MGHPEGEAQVNLSRADLEEKMCPKQVGAGAAGRHLGYRSDTWFSSDSSDRRLEDSFCIIQISVQIGSSSFGFRLVWVVEGFSVSVILVWFRFGFSVLFFFLKDCNINGLMCCYIMYRYQCILFMISHLVACNDPLNIKGEAL